VGERRRPTHPGAQFLLQLRLELRVAQPALHALLEPFVRRHQGLGDVAPAKGSIAALRVRKFPGDELREQALAPGGIEV